jgi:hypothetical protein
MLKTSQMLVVSIYDLQDFLKEKGYEIEEARSFFWPGDFMNDCYKSLALDNLEEEYQADENTLEYMTLEEIEEENAEIRLTNTVLNILREELGVDRILVDVSW